MRSSIFCAALVIANWTISSLSAETRTSADLLPASTVAYLEISDAESLLNLPLVQSLTKNELFQEIWRSPEVMKLRGGLTLAELALGERVPAALAKATAQGAVVAVDTRTKGVVLLACTPDSATCQEFYKRLVQIARQDALSKGNQDIKSTTYREMQAYEFNGAVVAAVDKWLVVSNQSELGKAIIDNFHEPKTAALSSVTAFAAARTEHAELNSKSSDGTGHRAMWAWADVAALKAAGAAKELFKRPDENFAAELLLGGLLATVREASTITASVFVRAESLHLQLAIPEAVGVKSADYQFFFGADESVAPVPLKLEGAVVSVSAYRDIAELWRRAGDLFGQRTNDQLAQADATLTTLFSGRDFGEEILGAVQPGLQVVLTVQDFDRADAPVPNIKLPAFALVTKLRNPAEMQQPLKRIFMSLIGFLNITGAMNRQPQLDVESFKEDAVTLVSATYAVDVDRPKDWVVPIQYNFSPTLAMVGDDAVVASTQLLARTVVEQLRKAQAEPQAAAPASAPRTNSYVRLDGPLMATSLTMNRDQLVSQNMLEKGHSPQEAAREIDLLLRLLGLVQSLELRFDVGSTAQLSADLQLKIDSANP